MIGDRLKTLRKTLKISQMDLAGRLDINPSAISQMESGKIRPSVDTLAQLSEFYGANLHWLITGVGSMFEVTGDTDGSMERRLAKIRSYLKDELDQLVKSKLDLPEQKMVELRVSGEIPAGPPAESVDTSMEVVTVNRSMISGAPEHYVCLRVNGHSMEPLVLHNDLVLIQQSQDWEKLNGTICALRIDGAITLKRLTIDKRSKMIVLLSVNEEYQPLLVDPREHLDITLIGTLRFLLRKF